MHILLIHQAFVLPSEPGGTRHYELAQHLIQRGYDFTVVASNLSYLTGHKTGEQHHVDTEQHVHGLHVLRAQTLPVLHRSFIWRIVAFLSFMCTSVWAALRAGAVDVVIGTSPPIFQAVSAWCVALLRRRPFVLEIRDLWPEFAVGMGVLTNPVLIALSRWLENFLYIRATHIVVNSPAYREYLLEKGIARAKISLVANGVDVNMFASQSERDKIREKLAVEDKFVVTYAGALGLANDIDTILRAASRLLHVSMIHFLVVGDGKEQLKLEKRAQDLSLTNVTFLGPQPKVAMPGILAASDACVATLQNIPVFHMTYPNKVFDYMAAGKPTILAIDGVIRDVIEAAQGGIFVTPGNDTALAEAVCMLSQEPQQARSMGVAARAYVLEHFDRRRQAAQFAEIVQQVVAK